MRLKRFQLKLTANVQMSLREVSGKLNDLLPYTVNFDGTNTILNMQCSHCVVCTAQGHPLAEISRVKIKSVEGCHLCRPGNFRNRRALNPALTNRFGESYMSISIIFELQGHRTSKDYGHYEGSELLPHDRICTSRVW